MKREMEMDGRKWEETSFVDDSKLFVRQLPLEIFLAS